MPLVATLIANPATNALTDSIAADAAKALQCRETVWLGKDAACDLFLPDTANAAEVETELRNALAGKPVDIVVQEADSRRKKLLIADMDSTMIQQECIDELAAEAGLKDHVSAITARAMNGEIEFEPALRERVALLKGLAVSVIEDVIRDRITLMPGGAELVATMRANGAYTALVSGGFTHFTSHIAKVLGFDENRANILVEAGGVLAGRVGEPILGRDAKVSALRETADRLGIGTGDSIAVGDGANDLGMLQIAGSGVALHAKPVVAAQAAMRIDHGDLAALLFIQGYRADEFVR